MPPQNVPIPASISELHAELEQFRSTHPKRTRLPLSLWRSAAELARQHGIYVVAHSARLDYCTLKKHVNGSSAASRSRPKKGASAKFVELIGAGHERVDEYVVEFESVQGRNLRVHCKTATPPDWAALLDAWRRVER